MVANNNAFPITLYLHDENGVLNSGSLPGGGGDAYFCSVGYPYSSASNVSIVFYECICAP